MLNLSQLAHSVKSQSLTLIPNPNHPLGTSPAYRELKAAGWTCHNSEVHVTDRVPVFRLGDAAIRRNRTGQSHWLLEIAGEVHPITDVTVADITAAVVAKLAETAIKPKTAAQEAADSLTAELTAGLADKDAQAISKRIASGLALVEAGAESQYNTVWQNLTALGNWTCDCPDATHRALTSKYGTVCKHTAAGLLRQRVQQAQAVTTQREVEKRSERRVRETALPVQSSGSILDYLDYDDPQPAPQKSGADIIREIEAQNAERYARENARYASAVRPDPRNLEHRPNVTLKGVGHR